MREMIRRTDEAFLAVTVPTDRCVWGRLVEDDWGLTPAVNWWYYRIPAEPSLIDPERLA